MYKNKNRYEQFNIGSAVKEDRYSTTDRQNNGLSSPFNLQISTSSLNDISEGELGRNSQLSSLITEGNNLNHNNDKNEIEDNNIKTESNISAIPNESINYLTESRSDLLQKETVGNYGVE